MWPICLDKWSDLVLSEVGSYIAAPVTSSYRHPLAIAMGLRHLRRGIVPGLCLAISLLLCGCDNGSDDGGTTTSSTSSTTTTTTTTTMSFVCGNGIELGGLKDMAKKGLAVDDNTFGGCIDKMPMVWPNTKERVRSLRIFRPWQNAWGDDYAPAWAKIIAFLDANDAKVLLGQDVTCDAASDDREWHWNLELMRLLGKDRIMGVAIGNEMDIYFQKPGATSQCIQDLWGGSYWEMFQSRVLDMDMMGLDGVKVTTVWAGSIMASFPFVNTPQARVQDFVRNASQTYGSRWVWSPTIYPIWDSSILPPPGDEARCQKMIDVATDMDNYVAALVVSYRQRIRNITNNPDDLLWVAETGWSSSPPAGLAPSCKEYCSLETLRKYYTNFLKWGLSTAQQGAVSEKGPDHIFYFTMRDSNNFGAAEYFGLVESCQNDACKLSDTSLLREQVDVVV